MPRAAAAAVALVSAGSLAFEILLVRLFAIEQLHHFAYMAIGVAMLGFGASGTLVTLARHRGTVRLEHWFAWSAPLAALALVASPVLVDLITLDPTALAWDAGQWPRLMLVYVLLAVPFALGALAVLAALAEARDRPGRIYGASFAGSGLGAALALASLAVFAPLRALALPAALAAVGGALAARASVRGTRIVSGVALALALLAMIRPPWQLDLLPYKALAQVEAYPESRRVADRSSPAGWVVAVSAPAFRFAPGLSLAYAGPVPSQTALFVDGESAGARADWAAETSAGFLSWLPGAAPFALGGARRALVIGAGGGTDVASAIVHGASAVDAVELHGDLVDLVRGGVQALAEPRASRVRWIVGDARGYTARADTTYDVLSIGPAGGMGGVAGGVHATNEDVLHTVEAYASYLRLLAPGGTLAITRWLAIPPRENVRVILTASEALRRVRPEAVTHGIVVLRSWATATTLVRPDGFAPGDVAALRAWATERLFDLDWAPGSDTPDTRFNFIDEPALFDAARAAIASREAARAFADAYGFHVAPATDARPYPHHFLRLDALRALLERERGDWLAFADWGYLALLATLVQSVVAAAALVLLPTVLRVRTALDRRLLRLVGYFGAIGIAYLAAEIAAIQQLTLLLGHPVYAVAAVLALFLVGSGIGSVGSDRLAAERGRAVATAIAVALAGCTVGLLAVVHALQGAPIAFRVLAAFAVLAPLAVLMGLPFPLGLRALAGTDTARVAWAWALNGFASVIAAPLAALVAVEWGSPAVFALGAMAYAGAAVAAPPAARGTAADSSS